MLLQGPGTVMDGERFVACTAMDKGWPRGLLLTRKPYGLLHHHLLLWVCLVSINQF